MKKPAQPPRHPPMRRRTDSHDADPETTDSRSPINHRLKESNLMTWRNRSACLDEDPELFFPIGNTYPALLQMEEAKVVCRRCEVVETCLKWASESGQDSGVWGGLSADERHALKRRNARARRASRVTPSLGGGTGAGPRPDPDQKCGPGQVRSPTVPT